MKGFLNNLYVWNFFQGHFEDSFPKFRYAGTVPSGDVHPVVWANEQILLDAVVNNGVFLCMKPGYYHFAAALCPNESNKRVSVYIVHNTRDQVYARYVLFTLQ